jgi:DNA-binding response OmpR family regulator
VVDLFSPDWPADDWVAIVDDEESVGQSLARYLRVSGLRARAFASAEEFLSYTALHRAFVIDVQLGTTTGFGSGIAAARDPSRLITSLPRETTSLRFGSCER